MVSISCDAPDAAQNPIVVATNPGALGIPFGKFLLIDRLGRGGMAEVWKAKALGPIVKRCLEFPIERPACPELQRWQAAIDARAAFAVAIGAKPSRLTPAA